MSNELITLAITTFTGLLAIMNPLATAPAFVGLVTDRSPSEKKRIAKHSCLYAFVITCCFVILGKYLFQLFGLTIPAFKITGGLLLAYIGFEKLISQKSKIQSNTNEEEVEFDASIAISPIAIPILAGPGTLVTAMNVVTNGSMANMAIVISVLAVLLILNFLGFRGSAWLMSHMNKNMVEVIGKIMGLILAIIGTGMLVSGIKLAAVS